MYIRAPKLNVGLEVDATGAKEFKLDSGSIEAWQYMEDAKYDISLFFAVALVLNAKGLYRDNGGLNYGLCHSWRCL
jgi:hypothetical protein